MASDIQLERRRLNEEIEDAFIVSAKAAANVEIKIISAKGNVFGDFLDFHNHFNYLIRLTLKLPAMSPVKDEPASLKKLKEDIHTWRHLVITSTMPQGDLEEHCRSGLAMFDDYYAELMHCGIISLPTRKG